MKLRSNRVTNKKNQFQPNKEVQVESSTRQEPKKIDDLSFKEKLEKLYADTGSAPSFSRKLEAFFRQYKLHSKNKRISKKTFPRRKVICTHINQLIMCDLVEWPDKYRFQNRNYRFILTVIDCFSKKLYAVPIKHKEKHEVAAALEKIISEFTVYPTLMVTDSGTEFFNSAVNKIVNKYGINHYKANSRTKFKASLVERVIRTLKTRIARYFQKNNTTKWIDILDQFVENYNNTPHSSTGLAPNDVTEKTSKLVLKRLYPFKDIIISCELNIGDR